METVAEIVESFARGESYDALAESARFLYVYNSTTLIASVGAIVGLILLGSLLWIAVASAVKPDKGGYSGGYSGGGYRKRRSLNDQDDYHFIELLAMLDDIFRRSGIKSMECQKRAVCEAHLRRVKGRLGPVARRIIYIFEKLNGKLLDELEPNLIDMFAGYLEAARHGRHNENCTQLYPACDRSLRDFVKKSSYIVRV